MFKEEYLKILAPPKDRFEFNFLLKPPTIAAIISFIVLAIFSGVLTAEFVMWDDDVSIYRNAKLGRLSLERIYWAFTDVDSTMRYLPLSLLSWSLIYHYFGLDPFGYHLANWLLHGLSAGVLFFIIRKILLLSRNRVTHTTFTDHRNITIIAALATLCWALHPLRVEPVAWATDLTYCLATFLLFVSTACYLEAVDSESNSRRYMSLMASAFIFYVFSLLSHAIGITYVAILFIFDIFLFKRIGGERGWWRTQATKKVLLEKIILANPAVLISVITVIVRVKSAGGWAPPVSLAEFGILDRAMQSVYIISYYLYRPFYPSDLAPVYTTLISFEPLSWPFLVRALILLLLSSILFVFGTMYQFKAKMTGSVKVVV